MSGRRCGDLGERCKRSQRLQLDLACGPRCICCKHAGSGRATPSLTWPRPPVSRVEWVGSSSRERLRRRSSPEPDRPLIAALQKHTWGRGAKSMAHQVHDRDISRTLAAADQWIKTCLVEDGSLFSQSPLWTAQLVDEVYHAFVEHPDLGEDDFITKLKGQMHPASHPAQQLLAEMLWALVALPFKHEG